MKRFYFHRQECGELVPDEVGHEFPDVQAAELHAITLARQIVAREVIGGSVCLGCSIDIHDNQGRLLVRVPFRQAVAVIGL